MRWPFSRRREPASPQSLTETQAIDLGLGIISESTRGVVVTPETALRSVPVLACVIVRAETLGSLPVHVYRRREGGRELLSDHPLARLVNVRWNPLLTAPEGWRWLQATEDIHGEAYVRVEYLRGDPVALWPLTASMRLRWSGGRVLYEYAGDQLTPAGTYPEAEILHFRGPLITDGVSGRSLVRLAADAVGITIDAERFYRALLARGLHLGTYLVTDQPLRQPDIEALQQRLAQLSGPDRAGEVRVFDRGLEPRQLTLQATDASLVEQQTWALQEVCRIFRVPPPLVQDWSRSTYTNSEQADLWFAKHTILPMARSKEAVLQRVLELRGDDRRGIYVRFALDGLLRGDFRTRAEGYKSLIYAGVMTRQEARALEELDEIPGLDRPVLPVNMAVLDDAGRPQASASPAAASPATVQALTVLIEAQREVVRRRARDDRERGRPPEATAEFARRVLAPVDEACRLAGVPYDLDADVAALCADTPVTVSTDEE
jgi:HK97 family phage portal protein